MPIPIPLTAGGLVPWVAVEDLNCTPCDVDPEVLAKAATIIADNLSGHQFGERAVRLRPRALLPSCHCQIGCVCGRATEILLPAPMGTIETVKVDGTTLGEADWVLYSDNRLVRVDGGTFPCCQRLNRDPDADEGTCEITGTIGAPPDEMAQLAVQEIVCELVKAFDDPSSCRLPKKTQSFTRQQLSVVVEESTTPFLDGFSGLPMVDLWLGALDADSQRRPGRAVDLAALAAWRPPAS